MNSTIAIAGLLSSFMALFLAAFLVLLPSPTRLANILLALFLVATATDISAWFMGDWWHSHPKISVLRPISSALQMPLFAGFILHSCFQDARLRARDAIHLMPALLVAGFILTGTPMPWLFLLLELQYLVYICAAILTLWRLNNRLKANFVGRSPSLHWLALLVATSLLAHGLYVTRTLLSNELSAQLSLTLGSLAALLVLAITMWIALCALLKPATFRGGDRLLASAVKAIEPGFASEYDRLALFMDEHHPYLDPDLSLERLSRRTGIGSKTLSALINQRQGVHFFDYINRFRVDRAKELLADSDRTVTEILYASGFNSKSTFNTAFRKHAGTTPSAYRREHREM